MTNSPEARFRWQVRGQVQGVGFRPFVFRRAEACQLAGFVRNDLSGVCIEAQGRRDLLERFNQELRTKAPSFATIENINHYEINVDPNEESQFRIETSCLEGVSQATITTDTAVCTDCLREIFSSDDRRAGYALTNCTACGPRYTILRRLPYDRPNTTMAEFSMCSECEREYTSPDDRRFHAQPIACPACGPTMRFVDSHGRQVPGDPIGNCAKALREGAIVAIKGIGGFHLATSAGDQGAVARLRRRKHRDAKPLAVMCRSMEEATKLVELGRAGADALQSPVRPIVLATRKGAAPVADNVAEAVDLLGVMLPYTPIHHLLFVTTPSPGPLVMTSGNLSDEPLVVENQEAMERLGGLCDFLLCHDRPIERRVDDSVVRDMGAPPPLPIRLARGIVPRSLTVPHRPPADFETGLCLGGELKNTIAIVRKDEVICSQHLGDLKHPLTLANFRHTVADLLLLYDVRPHWVACDLHPTYQSSLYALQLAKQWEVPLLRVQHHHAHAASLLAEYGRTGPVLAVVCDGVGYGTDRSIWGGELLMADLTSVRRMAHLRPLLLAGGDAAAVDTRRSALALLQQVVGDDVVNHPTAADLYPVSQDRAMLTKMLQHGVGCVDSTAAGRYFDGFAALLGVCRRNRFEAEGGMRLEAEAGKAADIADDGRHFSLRRSAIDSELTEIDLSPLVRQVTELRGNGATTADLALLIHRQIAHAWEAAVLLTARRLGIDRIALTGGVFCNRLLGDLLSYRLARRGLQVLRHTKVPCNDGGLAFGQAAVATALLNTSDFSRRLGTEFAPRATAALEADQTG